MSMPVLQICRGGGGAVGKRAERKNGGGREWSGVERIQHSESDL